MKAQGQDAQVDTTFSQMESAIKAFVEAARLSGLDVDDVLALLDAGLNIKEILELIGVKCQLPSKMDFVRSPWSDARVIPLELPYAAARWTEIEEESDSLH